LHQVDDTPRFEELLMLPKKGSFFQRNLEQLWATQALDGCFQFTTVISDKVVCHNGLQLASLICCVLIHHDQDRLLPLRILRKMRYWHLKKNKLAVNL
jgi:hypothetical protein